MTTLQVDGMKQPTYDNGTAVNGNVETMAEQAARLLDFNQKLDINLLDNVNCMYTGEGAQQKVAQDVLTTLKENPDAWTRVDTILEFSRNQQTKYYGLQILENVIKTRWKVLPRNQCEGNWSDLQVNEEVWSEEDWTENKLATMKLLYPKLKKEQESVNRKEISGLGLWMLKGLRTKKVKKIPKIQKYLQKTKDALVGGTVENEKIQSISIEEDFDIIPESVKTFEKSEKLDTMLFAEKIQVIVDVGKKSYIIVIAKDEKIENVRRTIQNILFIPDEHYYLTHSGKILKNGHKLSFYNIATLSTIHLCIRLLGGMKINVELSTGDKVVLEVDEKESLENIQKMVKDVSGIDVNDQHIAFSHEDNHNESVTSADSEQGDFEQGDFEQVETLNKDDRTDDKRIYLPLMDIMAEAEAQEAARIAAEEHQRLWLIRLEIIKLFMAFKKTDASLKIHRFVRWAEAVGMDRVTPHYVKKAWENVYKPKPDEKPGLHMKGFDEFLIDLAERIRVPNKELREALSRANENDLD